MPFDTGTAGHDTGLPSGLRTDGFYYQPHLSASRGSHQDNPGGTEAGEEDARGADVMVAQGAGGDGDRVYYVVGRGVRKAPGVEPPALPREVL